MRLASLRSGSRRLQVFWKHNRDTGRSVVLVWLALSVLAVLLAALDGRLAIVAAITGGVIAGLLSLRAITLPSDDPHAVRPNLRPAALVRMDRHELLILLVASPLFLFPLPSLVWATLLIPALWANRWIVRGYLTARSALNIPILLLLVMLGPAFLVAADRVLALQKLVGLVYGVALFFALLNARERVTTDWDVQAVSILAIGVSLIGLVSTDWPVGGKLSIYDTIYQSLPKLLHNVSRSVGSGINSNETGGTLAWLVPFLAAVWIGQPGLRQAQVTWRSAAHWFWRLVLMTAMVLSSGVLFLTQSRGAIIAVVVTLLILSAVYWRLARWLLIVAVVLAVALMLVRYGANPSAVAGALIGSGTSPSGPTESLDLHGRMEVWQSAIEMVQSSPLTGIGLNMYQHDLGQLGDPALADIPSWTVHAHDLFLQTAIDLGLPGLAAYCALLVSAFGLLLHSITGDAISPQQRVVAIALFAGLLAHQLYGLTDAITLGAKPGFILWIYLALAAQVDRQGQFATQQTGLGR